MTRMSSQHPGGIGLKTSAAFADSGDLRDIGKKLWGNPHERQENITKVYFPILFLAQLLFQD